MEPVLQAAEKIDHESLKRECEDFMVSGLAIENCATFMRIAHKFNLSNLSSACDALQRQKFSDLMQEQWFLPSLSLQDLIKYLRDDQLAVASEDQVLDAVTKWLTLCKANDKTKASYTDSLVRHVRFSLCDRKKLESAVSRENKSVLSPLKVKIYDYLCGKDIRGNEKPRTSIKPSTPREFANVSVPSGNQATRARTTEVLGASRESRDLREQTDETTVLIGGKFAGKLRKQKSHSPRQPEQKRPTTRGVRELLSLFRLFR